MTSIACLYDNRGWKAPKQSTLDVHPSGAARADDFHVLFEPGVDLPGVAIAADGAYGVTVAGPDELPRVLKDAQDAVGGRSAVVSVSSPAFKVLCFLGWLWARTARRGEPWCRGSGIPGSCPMSR